MRAPLLLALGACSFHPDSVGGGPPDVDGRSSDDAALGADAADPGDAPPFPDGAADAEADAEVVLGDWSPPVLLAISSSSDDDDPSLSANGLERYFASKRSGGDEDLFITRRDAPGMPWSLPELVPGLNSDQQDTDPDGLHERSGRQPGPVRDHALMRTGCAQICSPAGAWATIRPCVRRV
jgi:hypothetical protein